MSQETILIGSNAFLGFATRSANKALVNADATPTVTGLQLNGTAIATTGVTIIQQQDMTPANITGRYYVKIANTTTSGWADQATGQVQISATIGGVVCTEEIDFRAIAASINSPYIDVN